MTYMPLFDYYGFVVSANDIDVVNCEKVEFAGQKWQNNKTSVVRVALLMSKKISWIAIKTISEMMTKGIRKIVKEEISKC